MMKLGDILEAAIWITGDEAPEIRARYEGDVRVSITRACEQAGVIAGPVQWIEKRPEDDRVPEVPDHITGSRVRLLVAEAAVVAQAPMNPAGSFVANLDRIDLERLRALTRRQHAREMPGTLSDEQCDEIIEAIGPEAAIATLRRTVH
jgi:hypothetical protein